MGTFNVRHIEDIKSASVTSTGTVVSSQKGRLRGFHFRSTGTAGTIVLRDGGASGTTLVTIQTPAVAEGDDVTVPGGGIPFTTDLHATLTNVDGLTVFYAEDA